MIGSTGSNFEYSVIGSMVHVFIDLCPHNFFLVFEKRKIKNLA